MQRLIIDNRTAMDIHITNKHGELLMILREDMMTSLEPMQQLIIHPKDRNAPCNPYLPLFDDSLQVKCRKLRNENRRLKAALKKIVKSSRLGFLSIYEGKAIASLALQKCKKHQDGGVHV